MNTVVFGCDGHFAQYFKQHFFQESQVQGFDRQHQPVGDEHREAVSRADLVLFCTPYVATQTLLTALAPDINRNATIIDICSVKSNLYDLSSLRAANVVSLHPLYSPMSPPETRHCILCPVRGTLSTTHPFHRHFKMKRMTVDEHDREMAVVQAAVHFQNFVTAHFLTKHTVNARTSLYSVLHAVIERQMRQDPYMMAEIQIHNPHVPRNLASLKASFDELYEAVMSRDPQSITAYIEQARA